VTLAGLFSGGLNDRQKERMDMKRMFASILSAAFLFASWAAIAQSQPDGPVASPPGWSCYAKAGKVYCVKIGPR